MSPRRRGNNRRDAVHRVFTQNRPDRFSKAVRSSKIHKLSLTLRTRVANRKLHSDRGNGQFRRKTNSSEDTNQPVFAMKNAFRRSKRSR
jgi:hypothetical protein